MITTAKPLVADCSGTDIVLYIGIASLVVALLVWIAGIASWYLMRKHQIDAIIKRDYGDE